MRYVCIAAAVGCQIAAMLWAFTAGRTLGTTEGATSTVEAMLSTIRNASAAGTCKLTANVTQMPTVDISMPVIVAALLFLAACMFWLVARR